MIVGVAIIELHLPEGRSLKHKRRVVRPIIERIHSRFRVSIAETDYHDLHQRSQLVVAAVHQTRSDLDQILEAIRQLVETAPGALLLSWESHYLEQFN